MSYKRSVKEKEIYSRKYKEMKKSFYNKGYYYDKVENRIVKIVNRNNNVSFVARQSNKKIRKNLDRLPDGRYFRNVHKSGLADW